MHIKNFVEQKTINFFDDDNLWIEGLNYEDAEKLANEILKEIKGEINDING